MVTPMVDNAVEAPLRLARQGMPLVVEAPGPTESSSAFCRFIVKASVPRFFLPRSQCAFVSCHLPSRGSEGRGTSRKVQLIHIFPGNPPPRHTATGY